MLRVELSISEFVWGGLTWLLFFGHFNIDLRHLNHWLNIFLSCRGAGCIEAARLAHSIVKVACMWIFFEFMHLFHSAGFVAVYGCSAILYSSGFLLVRVLEFWFFSPSLSVVYSRADRVDFTNVHVGVHCDLTHHVRLSQLWRPRIGISIGCFGVRFAWWICDSYLFQVWGTRACIYIQHRDRFGLRCHACSFTHGLRPENSTLIWLEDQLVFTHCIIAWRSCYLEAVNSRSASNFFLCSLLERWNILRLLWFW